MDRFEEAIVLEPPLNDGFQLTSTSNRKRKRFNISGSKRRRFRPFSNPLIHCFSCFRPEVHRFGGTIAVLLAIASCGLYFVFGRYKCQCCRNPRWVRYDCLNLRYLFGRNK